MMKTGKYRKLLMPGFVISAGLAILLVTPQAFALNEECAPCHQQRVIDLAASSHKTLICESCHEGAANHGGNMSAKTTVHFDLEVCGGCHPDQYGTYIYGDGYKTKYGGSPELYSKLNDFNHYNDIIDGYGFTKEYNEERSHNVMLQDHFDVTRGKYDTCLQCKSTKAAFYWDSGRERTIENDVYVKAGHMTTGITVPRGTKVSMMTARDAPYPYTHEVRVLVTLPSGVMYSSYDYPGATKNGTWTWSALYALTVNELPSNAPTRLSGNGCNHCHNPHKVGRDAATGELIGWRIIRKSLIDAIGRRGLNPYESGSPKVFNGDKPLTQAEYVALCGQCHVEYVCGNSTIDGIDRDYFPWAKVSDLDPIYSSLFPGYGSYPYKYVQDWVHGTGPLSSLFAPGNGVYYNTPYPIKEDLIKSQHPEAETYWNSRHYGNNAPCFICHMPKVAKTSGGATFTSHWMASPLKYMAPAPVGTFAQTFGVTLDKDGIIPPCGACHGGFLARMKTKAENIQDGIYSSALTVEQALVNSLAAIKAAKDALAAGKYVNITLLKSAADDHRAAHVRWENLIISENSMGFHNPSEVSTELSNALKFAQSAKTKAQDALVPPRK
ncbi:MAG TPA: ammonia-forming cytochrome c nitrite reductase subunit c552 [Nitrospirota bacterium]|nr:ammonia-forming cytochrome c nitrite reductase subunit c552 [Nitrospirota bacterium]